MKRLLYHCCEFEVDVLDPSNYREDCICLSEHSFVGALGHFLYIFDYDVLMQNFNARRMDSGGYDCCCMGADNRSYHFRGRSLEKEYRIYQKIDVGRFALGVAENFNVLHGEITVAFNDEVTEREMIYLNGGRS